MTTRFTAIFENGVLRPTTPLALHEGQRVEVALDVEQFGTVQPSEDEIIRRVDNAQSLHELFEVLNSAPEDEDYDLSESLNENRRQSGASRLLFPPSEKGVSW